MQRNAIILGMPRSGTSLTARIFARQGYHFGGSSFEHVREGDDHNPFGYFEADDVIDQNVEVMSLSGFRFHNTWLFEPITSASVERIAQFTPSAEHRGFVQSYHAAMPWMWKDPRLCFTLPYWWKLMSPTETGVVLVLREPVDTYLSFRRKGWCGADSSTREEVLARIEQHIAAARSAIETLSIPHVVVEYDEYLETPDRVADRLNEFFGLGLSVEDLNVRPELDHSTLRGRISGYIRTQIKRCPRGPIRRVERMLPRRLLATLFPERRYTKGSRR